MHFLCGFDPLSRPSLVALVLCSGVWPELRLWGHSSLRNAAQQVCAEDEERDMELLFLEDKATA